MTASFVRVADGRLVVGDGARPLISGEVQFWRMDPEVWPRVLDQVVELGVAIISTYLSWRRHEPREGTYLWGETDPSLDVRRFLRLCAERDLYVQLKPGPWICAEETGGGYPDWLMARAGDLMLGADNLPSGGYNTPFVHPVPSMFAPAYLGSARRWLTEVWREVADFAYPSGPIIAVQLDNEPSMAFQDALYFADYHPLVIARFRAWLEDRYEGCTATWRQAWGDAAGTDFAHAEPPRPALSEEEAAPIGAVARPTPFSLAAIYDWTAFIEDSLIDHLAALRRIHIEAGVGHLLKTVNLIPNVVHEVPLRHQRIRDRLGPDISVGVDHYYEPPMSWELVNCLARTAASARAAAEPVVWAPELMAGIWRSPGEEVAYPSPAPCEQAAWWGAAIALGYQGFNFYMLADRQNWALAPISAAGDMTSFATPLRSLRELLEACPDMLRASPQNLVTVVCHRPDMMDAYTNVGTMRQPVVPWADPARGAAYDAWEKMTTSLVKGGFAYELWDSEADKPPAAGTTLLISEPSTVSPAIVGCLDAAGCHVVRVPPGAEPCELLDVEPPVRVTEHDPRTNVLAAVHAGPSHARYLHLVQWGTTGAPTAGRLRFGVDAGDSGAWRHILTDQPLPSLDKRTSALPSFTGHMVYKWVANSEASSGDTLILTSLAAAVGQ